MSHNSFRPLVWLQICIFTVFALNGALATAKDGNEALYDATAPADSAFARVINLADKTASVKFEGKTAVQTVGAYQVSDYVFFTGGKTQTIEVNGESLVRAFPTNSAWTLVFADGKLTPIEDKYYQGRKKAQVSFYNLSEQPLDLKTGDGKHAVVANVAPMANGQREINEVRIGLTAWAASTAAAAFEPTFLKKGRSYSYVVYPHAGSLKPIVVADAITSLE
ncbi:MAG: alginate O-acetyltransferase [unclassified Hahellaceae]|nr:alginate O-acetyltransferase [Hahellaceae bacterium]|tara:strand:- start:40808 stop:41473 length:666 start_codon:yes stop_codon:yes gene_type:complete